MTQDQLILTALLLLSLVVFAWGRWRHDLVAMTTFIATVLAQIVEPSSAFSGFGHPAVVTVAAVLIISHSLNNAGVVTIVSHAIRTLALNKVRLILVLTGSVAFFSAFMNNVGVIAKK